MPDDRVVVFLDYQNVYHRGPLLLKDNNLWNHYLDHSHYEKVRDDTDYLSPPN